MDSNQMLVGIGILTLFATILTATIAGTAAILWRIAKIDKDKVTWTACERFRLNCPCQKEIDELKGKNKK